MKIYTVTTSSSDALPPLRSSDQVGEDEGLLGDLDGLLHEGAPDLIPEASGFLVQSIVVMSGPRWGWRGGVWWQQVTLRGLFRRGDNPLFFDTFLLLLRNNIRGRLD